MAAEKKRAADAPKQTRTARTDVVMEGSLKGTRNQTSAAWKYYNRGRARGARRCECGVEVRIDLILCE
jgi:hypothetical protein